MALCLSSTIMRAACVLKHGDENVIEIYKDVQIPHLLPNEVLIKVAAVSVNIIDVLVRSGKSLHQPLFPYIPGNNSSGTIVKTGWKVDDFQVGDRVATFVNVRTGVTADYCVANTKWIVKLPSTFPFRKAACVGDSYMLAYRALFQATKVKPGSFLLVHGVFEAVPIAALQLASANGLVVIGSASNETLVGQLKHQGFHHAFNSSLPDFKEKVIEVCGYRGPDIILDMLANVNLALDIEICAHGGTICIIENRGQVEVEAFEVASKELHIVGVTLKYLSSEEVVEMKASIEAALKASIIDPVIGREYAFKDIREAHRAASDTHELAGSVVVIL